MNRTEKAYWWALDNLIVRGAKVDIRPITIEEKEKANKVREMLKTEWLALKKQV